MSVDLSGLQRAVDEACWKIDELRYLLEKALPYLREGVGRCGAEAFSYEPRVDDVCAECGAKVVSVLREPIPPSVWSSGEWFW